MVWLDENDFVDVFNRCQSQGIRGSTVYDALIAQAGIRVQVNQIVTLNRQHFIQLGPDVVSLLQEP